MTPPPPASQPPLLVVEGLSKRFGGVQALSELDLQLREGEIYGLIGPNGAGKTSFFNVLCGLSRPDRGRILFDGTPLPLGSAHRIARRGIARSFQGGRLFPALSVLDNVLIGFHRELRPRLGAILLNSRRQRAQEAELRRRAFALLDDMGVAAWAARPCQGLPLGIQRRVEIARALASGPRLLALDEPAAGMNAAESEALATLLAGLRARGISLLLVEHKMALVMALCDRIAVLDSGRKLIEDKPSVVRRDPAVIAAYLGRH